MSEDFEIVVEPEPEEHVVGIEGVNRQVDERAREQARVDFREMLVGQWWLRSEMESWPKRFREAYKDELARLRADRAAAG